MTFYSGFSLFGEETLFSEYLDYSRYCVAGFSMGAIDALLHVHQTDERVDKLQLFSPALFVNKDEKFKRLQLLFFQKDKRRYIQNFLDNASYPVCKDLSLFQKEGSMDDLRKLLYFTWPKEQLEGIVKKGIQIEVFLGAKDKIIDAEYAKEYFLPYATIYFDKEGGHILDG